MVDAVDAVWCVVSRGLLYHDGWKLLGDVGIVGLEMSVLMYILKVRMYCEYLVHNYGRMICHNSIHCISHISMRH